MTFTDDQLKRLKRWAETSEVDQKVAKYPSDIPSLITALLARLEAAERICQQTEIYITDKVPKMYRMKELLEAWRKAAGK